MLIAMKASNPSGVLLLDNPVWSALTTDQANLAQGGTLAKRFPSDVSPFAAMPDQSRAAYRELEETLAGEVAALALDTPPILPANWSMVLSGEMYQMVFEAQPPAQPNMSLRKLSTADVPEMLALTKLTEPGPFLPRTIELGSYFGKKPAILALVYYQCPMLCTFVLNGVLNSAKSMVFDIGKEYDIVTVSIDPTETPLLAESKH